MKGLRGALAAALGLALMQLVLSTSEGGGKSAGLLNAGLTYPAQWVRSIVNAQTPAIPDLSASTSTASKSSTPTTGLSGTGTPAGTGSNLISI